METRVLARIVAGIVLTIGGIATQAQADCTPPLVSDNKTMATVQEPLDDSVSDTSQWEKGRRWLYVSYLDLTKVVPDPGVQNQTLASLQKASGAKSLAWYSSTCPIDGTVINQAPTPAPSASTVSLPPLTKYTDGREFIYQQDSSATATDANTLVVAYIYIESAGQRQAACDESISITFSEESRQTAATKGLTQLLTPSAAAAAQSVGPGQVLPTQGDSLCMYAQAYSLEQDRGTVTISVDPSQAQKNKQSSTQTILTGKPEWGFFSIDALINNASQVELDATTNTLVTKKAPNSPMISYNLMIGDPYKQYDDWTWKRFVPFKFGAITGHPRNQMSLGFGYLFNTELFNSGNTAGSFMLFVSRVRTATSTGPASYSWGVGISYNVGAFGIGSGGGGASTKKGSSDQGN